MSLFTPLEIFSLILFVAGLVGAASASWRKGKKIAALEEMLHAAHVRANDQLQERDTQLRRSADERRATDALVASLHDKLSATSRERADAILKLSVLQDQRNVAWTRPPRRVPPNEIRRAFAIDDKGPLWIALHQELDDQVQRLVDVISAAPSATFTETNRLHAAGGLDELREFQKHLLDLQASAQKKDADLEDEDEPAQKGAAS